MKRVNFFPKGEVPLKKIAADHDKEQREKREKEPVEVARLFLFQSRKAEDIADDEDIGTMHFTEMLLIHKGGDVNAGQVMPIGGKIDKGESPLKAVMRETVEEAHLRPSSRSVREVGTQSYSFNHSRKGRLDRLAHYYKGKIGPQDWDVPYPLHPEEDKIADFVRFSPDESERLLTTHGYVERDGKRYAIQDALNPHERIRFAKETETDETERESIAEGITLHHTLTDARKKMKILDELLTDVPLDDLSPQGRAFVESLQPLHSYVQYIRGAYESITAFDGITWDEAMEVLPAVDEIWVTYATRFTMNDIKLAFVRADHQAKYTASFNFKYNKETERHEPTYNEETADGVPTAALIFPLLLNDHLRPGNKPDVARIRELRRNPTMRNMMNMTARVRNLLRKDPDLDDGDIILALHEVGMIVPPPMTYAEMSFEVDLYFEELRKAAGLRDDEAPIDQLDEMKFASLADLFRFASSSTADIMNTQTRVTTEAEARVFQWEAQRKLVLLLLLNDAVDATTDLKVQTTQDIDTAQQKAMVALDSPLRLYAGKIDHKKRPNGTKELMSVLRKMIVRDKGINMETGEMSVLQDYFAESYVFDDVPDEAVISRVVELPPELEGRVLKNNEDPVDQFYAPKVVEDLIVSILEQDPNVRIIQYKPHPESGGPIQSEGAGGGGAVRFGKFYIEHTDEQGIVTYKEIQVFIPDPAAGLTGAQEFERKKIDDRRYGVQRLFHTKGIRSFMELLYPAVIYDEFNEQIHGIFSQRAG